MTTPTPSNRLSIAFTAAVASTTVAIGVTLATLLGWFAPAATAEVPPPPAMTETAAEPTAGPSIIYVPVTPAAPEVTQDLTSTVAMQVVDEEPPREHRRHDDDDDDRDRHHDDDDDDDDDEGDDD